MFFYRRVPVSIFPAAQAPGTHFPMSIGRVQTKPILHAIRILNHLLKNNYQAEAVAPLLTQAKGYIRMLKQRSFEFAIDF